MQRRSILLLTVVISLTSATYAQDILNNMFRPSVDRGYIIDIGDSKDSVGASLFEGGVDVDLNLDRQKACFLHNVVIETSQEECTDAGGTRTPHTYSHNNTSMTTYWCVSDDQIQIRTTEENCEAGGVRAFGECKVAGRTVHANNETECIATQGNREPIEDTFEANRKAPLFVRIAQLLLRITLTLSVTFIIYSAIMYALSFGDSSKAATAQKRLLHIAIGIIIALSNVAIIYLIQSVITQSLR